MLGFAALTVLSLLWMALSRALARAFGRKASATLRSVYPIVLGLGGWFLGVLIVMTTMPGVPLDDALLAALSVGMPIGLGVYLAWVNRDWPPRRRPTGFAAAVGGALVGGWLGFNAAEGAARADHHDRRRRSRCQPGAARARHRCGLGGHRRRSDEWLEVPAAASARDLRLFGL